MSEEKVLEYLEDHGGRCFFCKSPNITAGSSEYESDSIIREVWCNDCKRTWFDVYTLTSVVASTK